MKALVCWWRGHDEWTVRTADGVAYAPPCFRCGRPNDLTRWRHKYREFYETVPPEDFWVKRMSEPI